MHLIFHHMELITGAKINIHQTNYTSSSPHVVSYYSVCCQVWIFHRKKNKTRGQRWTITVASVCITVLFVRQGTDTPGVFVREGPLFTGWSGRSDVWLYRAARRGLAGKTPPTGSSQWSVFDHHPDCRAPPRRRPSKAEDAHMGARKRWLTDCEFRWWLEETCEKSVRPGLSEAYSQVRSESVWLSACGTVTVRTSLGCSGCPSGEKRWKQKEDLKL